MAVSLVNSTITYGTADEISVAKPSGLANGDLLIFRYLFIGDAPTLTEVLPSGVTLIHETRGNAFRYYCTAYKYITNAAGEPSSYAFALTGETGSEYYSTLQVTRISGADPTNPINASALSTNLGTTQDITFPTVTTTVANCLTYYAGFVGSVDPSGSQFPNATTTGLTLFEFDPPVISQPGAGSYGAILYGLQATAGAVGTKTISAAVSNSCWYASTIAIKPAPAVLNGSANITEASDTVVSTGKIVVKAAANKTEASDTLTASAKLVVKAATSVNEANDTLTATGKVVVKSSANISEASDTLVANGRVILKASVNKTEASDTLTASAKIVVKGQASITEASDTTTSAGKVPIGGQAGMQEASDTVVATGKLVIKANASINEASDTSTGHIGAGTIHGAANITEASDTLTATTKLVVKASTSINEANDILTSTATHKVQASAIIQEANDNAAGSAKIRLVAIANITEDSDTLDATATEHEETETPDIRVAKSDVHDRIASSDVHLRVTLSDTHNRIAISDTRIAKQASTG